MNFLEGLPIVIVLAVYGAFGCEWASLVFLSTHLFGRLIYQFGY